jgi:hypothetical protein
MHVAGDWFQSAQREALLGVENLRWRSTNKMPLLHNTHRDQQLLDNFDNFATIYARRLLAISKASVCILGSKKVN